jgi:hypothetical protein
MASEHAFADDIFKCPSPASITLSTPQSCTMYLLKQPANARGRDVHQVVHTLSLRRGWSGRR